MLQIVFRLSLVNSARISHREREREGKKGGGGGGGGGGEGGGWRVESPRSIFSKLLNVWQ